LQSGRPEAPVTAGGEVLRIFIQALAPRLIGSGKAGVGTPGQFNVFGKWTVPLRDVAGWDPFPQLVYKQFQ
jgi:hypothetical protein